MLLNVSRQWQCLTTLPKGCGLRRWQLSLALDDVLELALHLLDNLQPRLFYYGYGVVWGVGYRAAGHDMENMNAMYDYNAAGNVPMFDAAGNVQMFDAANDSSFRMNNMQTP